ncbi:hypothetical protein RDWZM_005812 [Blomia tropicalis]|uniref:Fanconi-associated nuclease n=1 Tax=Blomia tropicalis TaxID=40697 RepID=A0A9Q0RMZ1_BLOTA|nr:hypothetical protein RDWZM_005812 [Blomia tropicalis]
MLQQKTVKQSSILDFFRRKNGSLGTTKPLKDLNNGNDATNGSNGKDNNKRPYEVIELDCEGVKEVKFQKTENEIIDVNFISENILDISIETENVDQIMKQKLIKFDDDIALHFKNDFILLKKFRMILASILSEEVHAHLFDENDWEIIENFTSFPASNINSLEEGLALMSLPELKSFIKLYPGINFAVHNKVSLINSIVNYANTSRVVSSDHKKKMPEMIFDRLKEVLKDNHFRLDEYKSNVFKTIFMLYYSPEYSMDQMSQQDDHQWIFGKSRIHEDSYLVYQNNPKQVLYSTKYEFNKFLEAFQNVCNIRSKLKLKKFRYVFEDCLPLAVANFKYCFENWHKKDEKLEPFLRNYTATGMHLKAIRECLPAIERLKEYVEFIEIIFNVILNQSIYGINHRGKLYVRSTIVCQAHLKNSDLAIQTCIFGLTDSHVKWGNRLELFERLQKMINIEEDDSSYFQLCPDYYNKIFKKKEIEADCNRFENDSHLKNFFVVTNSENEKTLMSVESIVIRHYLNNGFKKGIHSESTIYQHILALLFWDQIYFTKVADSFRYHNQFAPLDMNYSLYKSRQTEIDKRLVQVSQFTEMELISEISTSWKSHHEKQSFVKWNETLLDDILNIAICLSSPKVSAICHFMISDYKNLHKGLPDLIVWNPLNKAIKIIEVKSEHDQLSSTQTIWLTYLTHLGLDVEVCHVKPKGKP